MSDDLERLEKAWRDFKQTVWAERPLLLLYFLLVLIVAEGVVLAATLLF